MQNLNEKILALKNKVRKILREVENTTKKEEFKALEEKVLSKKGLLSQILLFLKEKMMLSKKKKLGSEINTLKKEIVFKFTVQKKKFQQPPQNGSQQKNPFQNLMVGYNWKYGSQHPLFRLTDEIKSFFLRNGFICGEDFFTDEITTEKMNFYELNFPKNHPAINQQDTFYVEGEQQNKILRTHCSVVTYRVLTKLLRKKELCSGVFTIGEVYRRDTDDKTHNHQFSQLDVVVVGKKVCLQDLFRTVNHFLMEILRVNLKKIFWRRSFFPFTSPSFEVDVACPFCGDGCEFCSYRKKIEVLGAGMISEKILLEKGNPYQKNGFAFGIGVDRLLMIRELISDVRIIFQNHLLFLKKKE